MKIVSLEKIIPYIVIMEDTNNEQVVYRRSGLAVWEKQRMFDWERVYPQERVNELERLFQDKRKKERMLSI